MDFISTPYHFLLTIKRVATAINKLKTRTLKRSMKFLTNKHLEIMNDKTYVSNISRKKDDFLAMLMAKTSILRIYYKIKIFILKINPIQKLINNTSIYRLSLCKNNICYFRFS